MKRSTFVIIGFGIIVFLFGLWVYSLLYGTPKEVGELFPDFDFYGGEVNPVPIQPDNIPTEEVIIDVTAAKLRQLTTRPVIGFSEQFSTTSEPRIIIYAEAGTGHIYSIDLTTGEELRISNITVPAATEAVFNPRGDFAAIRSGYTSQNNVVLIDLRNAESASSKNLSYKVDDFSFETSGNFIFTEETSAGTIGKKLALDSDSVTTIFTVPFLSTNIVWSERGNTPTYVYPKASARLLGYLYEIKNSSIYRIPVDGSGLTAEAGRDYVIYSKLVDIEQKSFIYNLATNETVSSPIITTPEKCTFSVNAASIIYCGYEITEYSYTFPDEWYKGVRTFNDSIWKINLNSQSATQLINPLGATGRQIDITDMTAGAEDSVLYFINKNDSTLWVYEL